MEAMNLLMEDLKLSVGIASETYTPKGLLSRYVP
jgi:hypothetical protein